MHNWFFFNKLIFSSRFSFSSNDIDVSSKVADKSDKNNGKGHKTQSEIYRFLASDPNFKVRKKMKFK